MGLTATQLAARAEGIGASEIGAIMGLDPFKNAWAVWAEKTGKVAPQTENDAMRWGNLLEPVILKCAEDELKKRVIRPTGTYKHDNGIMFANIDGMVVPEGEQARRGCELVECKSSRIQHGWGEPGTDQMPDRVMLQVTAQMMCAGSDNAYVARMGFGNFGLTFGIYPVTLDSNLAEAIEEACVSFWANHVQKDIAPENIEPDLETAKRIIHKAGVTRPVAHKLVTAYIDAREAAKLADEAKEQAQAALLAALEGAEIGACDGYLVTNKMINVKRLDTSALKDAHPDLVERFTKPAPYARLDVRTPKVK
jgi:putative phage-type endonuclease